jgi:adenine-specific DNA-methyltransferase
MNKEFTNIITQNIEDENLVNQIIVTAFVKGNNIQVINNNLIKCLILPDNNPSFINLSDLEVGFSFEQLIEAFEVAVPSKDQQVNGAVYTPEIIKDFIVHSSISKLGYPAENILSADIACGCGAFLYTLAVNIHKQTRQSFKSIIENQIFGIDINESSIIRAKILLSLLALSKGEDFEDFKFNLYDANSLNFDWTKNEYFTRNNGFDLIIGNPPYVRARNIDQSSKQLLKNWDVTKSGNPDLYIPFFEIGLKYLKEKGVLGYVTVNSFYKSVNARFLRKYLQEQSYDTQIIDFGDERIFGKKSTYSCICFIKKEKTNSISFVKTSLGSLKSIKSKVFTSIPYSNLNHHNGWLLGSPKALRNITKIEDCGKSLGSLFPIKNGIATLSNDIYIFKPVREYDSFFYLEKDKRIYKIEKEICRDIIKPNILKYEHEIPDVKEKLIYPYANGISPFSLIREDYFIENYPYAYNYLKDNKEQLDHRDKGNGDYGAWYGFGRTQALNDKGLKLMFPYMAKRPYFVFTDQEDLLIYCGYAIFSDSKNELSILKKLLESRVFDYYMKHTSKPYSSGYLSYAKNYVKNFGVCEITEEEKKELLNPESTIETDDFFINKYNLEI